MTPDGLEGDVGGKARLAEGMGFDGVHAVADGARDK